MKMLISILIGVIVSCFGGSTQAHGQGVTSYEISLKSGTIVLEKGSIELNDNRYVVVQFDKAPKRKEVEDLRGIGINLLSFLCNKAWLCAVEPSSLTDTVRNKYAIAAVTPWKPDYKISPKLRQGKFEQWAVTESGRVKLLITFFKDVSRTNMESLLRDYSATHDTFDEPNTWAIQIPPGMIDRIIDEPIVQSVEEGPRPFEPLNDLSRAIIHVDTVQDIDTGVTPPVYNGLSGDGVNIAVSESVFTLHPDFWEHDFAGNPTVSRFLNPHGGTGSIHGTHVAGTIGGNGWNSDKGFNSGTPYQWRGMAPEASLISGRGYGSYRVDASNHSYVLEYGAYGASSSAVDKKIRGGTGVAYKKPHIWAVANQGLTPQYDNEVGYYSIYAPAKNPIGVGAVNANDGSLVGFSSLGPTFDGRIKPDVMAGGCKNRVHPEFCTGELSTVHIDYIRILDNANTIVRRWEFNTDGDFEGWFEAQKNDIFNEEVSNGYLSFQVEILGDGFGFAENVNVVTTNSQFVDIRYRIENPSAPPFTQNAALLWTISGSTDYVDGVLDFEVTVDDQFHVVSIPVGQFGKEIVPTTDRYYFRPVSLNGWQGTIATLRIDPLDRSGGIVSTDNNSSGFSYKQDCGTSMAAPATTGTVALMLQQFKEKHGVNIDSNPPLPSTIKAVLIQTATDMVHQTADPRDPNNPDTGAPVLYHKGPDFATGYGLVNAKAAVDFVEDAASENLVYESELDVGQKDVYEINVASALPELKVTLVWDDVEASSALGDQRKSRLVNDLDLVLIDPDGNRHYPWRLNPPPVANCGGSGPGCGDLDPIRASDITPAYKGPDARNNVEQVQIENPPTGKWKVLVEGFDIQDVRDSLQAYSLVANKPLSTLDLDPFIVTPNSSHSIEVRLSNDDGSFHDPVLVGDDLDVNYAEFAIADFNGDGQLDFIASTNENPAKLYLFSRTGLTTFQQSFFFMLDEDPKAAYYLDPLRGNNALLAPDYGLSLIVADLDNNGNPDILENINHNFGDNLFWIAKGNAYLNDGSGKFTKVANAFDFSSDDLIFTGWTLGMSNTVIDVHGDGYPDMLASEQSSGGAVSSRVYLLKGNGDGTFQSPQYVFTTAGHPATHMTLGDFNNDGKVDALVGQDDDGDPGAAFLFLGHGDGTFEEAGIEAFDVCKDIESGLDQPCGGKFQTYEANMDGILDIISAYKVKGINDPDEGSNLVFLKGRGDGTFEDDDLPTIESDIIYRTAFQAPMTLPMELRIRGDLNGDRCIDRPGDLNMILTHIRAVRDPLLRDLSFDLNGDGGVNIADARKLVTLFSNPRGVPCQ